MKVLNCLWIACTALVSLSSLAETVAWYRFEDGEPLARLQAGASVTNSAGSEFTAALRTISSTTLDGSIGDAYWPTFTATSTTCAVVADITVGVRERASVAVPEGGDVRQEGRLTIAPEGALLKTGAGRYTVPLSALAQRNTASFGVREGTLAFDSWNAADVVCEQPVEVMNRAALWFDASKGATVLTTSSNDTAWVDGWLDVRETGNATDGYLYPRAVANLLPSGIAPSLVEKEGTPAIYFGGFPSGVTMNWTKPDGSLLTLGNIRHAFLIHGVWNSYGFILGITGTDPIKVGGTSRFHISDGTGGSPSGNLYRGSYVDTHAPYTGRVFLNGAWVDPCSTTPLQKQFQLLEVDCCGVLGNASNFFNDRNYFRKNPLYDQVDGGGNRIGGDYLSEAVVFTNALTEAERLAVGNWLMKKWLGLRKPACSITLAENAAVEMSAETAADTLAAVRGDGRVVKTDDSFATYFCSPSVSFGGSLSVATGTLGLCPRYPLVFAAGDRYTVSEPSVASPTVSRAADAGAGAAVKDGNGYARVTGLPADVTNLTVAAGTLSIAVPEKTHALIPGGVQAAIVPNGTFDDGKTTAVEYKSDTVVANWHLVGLSSENNSRDVVIFTGGDGSGVGWLGTQNPYFAPLPAPDNGRVMMVKGDASAWTEVTVPVDGTYEIAFLASARGNGYDMQGLDVCIGPDADHLERVGSFTQAKGSYTRHAFRTQPLARGTYQLWFRTLGKHVDKATSLAKLEMNLVVEDDLPKMAVPNGSFEAVPTSFSATSPNGASEPDGWTFTQGTPSGTLPGVFVSTRSMSSQQFYDAPFSRHGDCELCFSGSNSVAETSFTATRSGTYRLRFDAAALRYTNYATGSINLTGQLIVNGVTNDLGTVTLWKPHLSETTLPNAVTVASGDELTLRLTTTFTYSDSTRSALALVDNLVLVESVYVSEAANLIANGGFESEAGWHFVVLPKANPTGINGCRRWNYSDCKANYGYAVYEGSFWLAVVQNDIAWRTFDVPEAGLHRLTFYAHSRADSVSGYGANPVNAFWMDPEDPATTNWIGRALVVSSNFVECTFNFLLPKKNGLVLGLQGGYSHIAGEAELTGNDHTTILDGVSVRRVKALDGTLPDVAEYTELSVAAGAKVRLDYDGVLELRSLRLGGSGHVGEISAEDFPDFLSGPGRIFVKPRGTLFIFR